MDDFKTTYNKFLIQIENLLDNYIPKQKLQELYEPFNYIITGGGKRIRPVLTMISAGAVGGNPSDAVYAAACMEIMHNFTLVHDDIMDDSSIRRGKKTIHIKWDEPTAILTGDVMIGYAYKLLENYNSHPNLALIYSTVTNGLIEVCEGQVYDMVNNTKSILSHDDYFLTIHKKTAKILETCVLLGGLIGRGENFRLKALSEYAISIGLAFQIQDDILDLIADETELGKHIGQDIIEGKKTWLMLEARNRAEEPQDRALIHKFYENNGLPETDISTVRAFLQKTRIIDDAAALAQKHFDKAKKSLTTLDKNEYTIMLEWLVDSLNKRKY